MKRWLVVPAFLMVLVPLLAASCDTTDDTSADTLNSVPGVCTLSTCPKPSKGIACCTPNAECGMDPSGIGLACQPNPDQPSGSAVCRLADCPVPLIGNPCCTPLGTCGTDPLGTNLLCMPNPPPVHLPEAGMCDLTSCPQVDGGPKACCQSSGACGVDPLGIGLCLPPAPMGSCDITTCPVSPGGFRNCCQLNGLCGIDLLGIGLCFPDSFEPCDAKRCPAGEGGEPPCCQSNNQCGTDTLGIGLCLPPAPPPTCDLAQCPASDTGVKSCCLPNGNCGLDSLGIGLCFPPALPLPDGGGVPVSTTPPDDPSITGECPSFLGLAGPVWGCCSKYGVCGTFGADQCLLPIGTQLPVGPPPAADSGVTEPFLRCTPPAPTGDQ